MKFFAVVCMAVMVTVALAQGKSSTTSAPTTPAPTTSTTLAPKTTTTEAPTTTSTSTQAPTTNPPTTHAPVTTTSTTTTPAPKPQDATLGNYTLLNGDKKVCALVLAKIVISQNATNYAIVNGTLVKENSRCNDTQVTLWIEAEGGYNVQIKIEHDVNNFYISSLSVRAAHLVANRENLTQFSTPLKQFYKCGSASQVSLEEEDVNIVFSEMKYQAFQKADSADFVGNQLECVSDYHSDVVIIAIGCALALLVVVILVAYLIARRRNRQRGYQSV